MSALTINGPLAFLGVIKVGILAPVLLLVLPLLKTELDDPVGFTQYDFFGSVDTVGKHI